MKKVLIVLGILVLAAFGYLTYSGLLASIKVVEKDLGPYTFAYKEFKGPYKDVGPVFEDVQKILNDDLKLTPGESFGIYYDDPAKVAAKDLKSEIGFIIEKKDADKIEKIKEKLKVKDFPETKSVMAEFPLRTMMSYMLGPMRVYPKLAEYMKGKEGYKTDYGLEIYKEKEGITIYAYPLK